MTPEQWAAIVSQVVMAIATCLQNRQATPEEVSAIIRSPRGRHQLKWQRSVRQGSGLLRKEWRQQKDRLMAEAEAERKALTDEDIADLIDEALPDAA